MTSSDSFVPDRPSVPEQAPGPEMACVRSTRADHIYPAEQLAPLYDREAALEDRLADAGVEPASHRAAAARSREMAARARAHTSPPLLIVPPNGGPTRIAGWWDHEAAGYRCPVCPAVNTWPAVAERHAEVAHGVDQLPEDRAPGKASK
ncbi:hypothetical protein [Actinoplanes teichomyceticus]|uniref:hypothetical protein n=2 Tax=Actinoplanes teichomyceticus TaxID=1867 RepID=UPI0013DE541D|nr:hypothetical protein [Actinoplanes teichomyceticus]GIF17192.1 hypothetical protein Ate01nite_72240 [Actinoplanes teichomyceticus]